MCLYCKGHTIWIRNASFVHQGEPFGSGFILYACECACITDNITLRHEIKILVFIA